MQPDRFARKIVAILTHSDAARLRRLMRNPFGGQIPIVHPTPRERESATFMKRLKSVCLVTHDVPELRDFYANVLEVTPEGDDSFAVFSGTEINLSISSTEILEEMAPGSRIDSRAGNCFLEFEVENVDKEYERLKVLNVEVIKPPTTQPWGLRSVWFCDSQGNRVNFYAHVAPSGLQDK